MMPKQASLFRSGVPLDSPLKGHLQLEMPNYAWLSQELMILFHFVVLCPSTTTRLATTHAMAESSQLPVTWSATNNIASSLLGCITEIIRHRHVLRCAV